MNGSSLRQISTGAADRQTALLFGVQVTKPGVAMDSSSNAHVDEEVPPDSEAQGDG